MKHWLLLFLWPSSALFQLAIAAVIVRRGLRRDFPIFFSYTLFRACTVLAIFILFQFNIWTGLNLYHDAAWVHETGCILLRFAVIYELFRVFSKTYSDLNKATVDLFQWGMAVLLFLSVMIGIALRANAPNGWIDAGLNVLDRTVDVVQVGLLLIMIFLVRYLRLSWRSYSFGIAVGLGIFAAVDLATSAILAQSGTLSSPQQQFLGAIVDLVNMGTYQACVFIWLVYALVPERTPKPITTLPEHDLAAWNHELRRLLQR